MRLELYLNKELAFKVIVPERTWRTMKEKVTGREKLVEQMTAEIKRTYGNIISKYQSYEIILTAQSRMNQAVKKKGPQRVCIDRNK